MIRVGTLGQRGVVGVNSAAAGARRLDCLSRAATTILIAARMPTSTSAMEIAAAVHRNGDGAPEFCASMIGHWVPTSTATAALGMMAVTAGRVHAVLEEL